MKISVLGSGSAGNCSFIEVGGKKILVDVGYSLKKIEEKLEVINQKIEEIDAIFVTHDHSDHIKAFGTISRKYDIPLYVHEDSIKKVYKKLGKVNMDNVNLLNDRKVFLDNILVENFDVMHDSAHNLGYSFYYKNEKLSYVTDIGKITNIVKKACIDSDFLAFESNYDMDMLLNGSYHWNLKNRVKSNVGHISNEEATKFLTSIANNRLKKIILLHLSGENNTPDLAYNELRPKIDKRISIELSSQAPTKIFEFKK
ncbi:MBL fold metallo-hydrolase [Caviibacter abscessus]|uniref:MBL fold metallo-hydrolase n=1 Tax=Caviibacter abscessus TaxID=1766719 RepID=UPI000836F0FB|nr:MBL fold metallo-hydrolase [Caviibacter abscessus]